MKNYSVLSLWLLLSLAPCISTAQVAINSFTTVNSVSVPGGSSTQVVAAHAGSVNTVTPSANYTVRFNNSGNISITNFTYSGKSYVRYAFFDTVIVRRVANAWETTAGNKQHIYCQGPAAVDNVTFNMPFPVAYPQVAGFNYMERVMKDGFVNRGSDNVFNNDASSDLTFNNIERVDFVCRSGVASKNNASAGFLIAERGGNDAFKMAAILSIDAHGNPTSFGPVISVAAASYGSPIATVPSYVMRKDAADNTLRPFSLVPSQAIRAVFVRFSDLSVPNNYTIYGYALMATDVTAATSSQLLNFTNSTYFPTTTNNSQGGMDLASAPGVFHTDLVLSVEALTLSVRENSCTQLLSWTDEDYRSVAEYQVEKSTDGSSFEKIAVLQPSNSGTFQFEDTRFEASSFYRLKVMELDGSFYYSATLYAKFNCHQSAVSIYPNPVRDFVILSFANTNRDNRVNLVDVNGNIRGQWMNKISSNSMKIDMSSLPAGMYFIHLTDNAGKTTTYRILKQ